MPFESESDRCPAVRFRVRRAHKVSEPVTVSRGDPSKVPEESAATRRRFRGFRAAHLFLTVAAQQKIPHFRSIMNRIIYILLKNKVSVLRNFKYTTFGRMIG